MKLKEEFDFIDKLTTEWKEGEISLTSLVEGRMREIAEYGKTEEKTGCPICAGRDIGDKDLGADVNGPHRSKNTCGSDECEKEYNIRKVATSENESEKKHECTVCARTFSDSKVKKEEGVISACPYCGSGNFKEVKEALKESNGNVGASGNTDWEVDDVLYNFDYEVDYQWYGTHTPASESGPEEWPELDINDIKFTDIEQYTDSGQKKLTWEELPEATRNKIYDGFAEWWEENFVEETPEPDDNGEDI